MSAEQLLAEGRLDDALSELKQAVRKDAANPKQRVFLFQLLAVQGDWERALNQLEVSGQMDPAALPMVQTYREAIRCENLRAAIFAGKRSPLIFGDPEHWLALLLESLQRTAAGQLGEAARLRDEAFAAAPATSGTIDDQAFAWIADADPRLGPILEAVVEGRYYWIPFHRIRTIQIEAPADLRDVVWMPAYFTWANGGESVGLIPTRYPGSESSADEQIRLSRKTEWLEPTPGTYLGLGQRMLTTDAGDFSLMDVRRIDLDVDADHRDGTTRQGEPHSG
ncbi:tetratricopeptide repeat protein [Thiorhodococcus mannitoliphagus]|uniref:Tetratricopeptide repeat protein n=1 Tax=Thiorhodococcus mannitoliphagus TaxID=329406 RepID=A0A6P1E045_9GAMM|nr:type VI secretion system accessory protein TagJ [Thiorhodococcus mannitoliphagus]NEX22396.1 tetratricopeptide repeat protein [Thiorhodococcus mannitoliphagus]